MKNTNTESKPRTNGRWLDYVSDKDKKVLAEIKARAEKAMAIAIAQEAVKNAEAYLEQLMKGAN